MFLAGVLTGAILVIVAIIVLVIAMLRSFNTNSLRW